MAVLSQHSMIDGKYRILKFLAQGGMGLVWLGEVTPSKYAVVAKEPKITGQQHTDKVNLEKLQVEGSILRLLSHKNIVRFVDMCTVSGIPILLTEFVPGENLDKLAAGRPMNEEEAVAYVVQLLDAVEYMHSMNIIHRDIRPKNLIARTNERFLKLIDFGTAKFFHKQLDTPEAIISPGGYSPPEHYHLGYSPQGDIWSAGATLFFLVTGQHPLMALSGYPNKPSPLDISKLKSSASDLLREVVSKSLQPQPAMRFLTAREMRERLQGAKVQVHANPVLIIRNQEIPIKTTRIIVGRDDRFDFLFSGVKDLSLKSLETLRSKPNVRVEGDRTLVKLVDPGVYISRAHVEIFEKGGGWYVKDSGSLNGSAILSETGWRAISRGHMAEGTPHQLATNNLVSLGYNERRGPYLVITFALSEPSSREVTYSKLRQ